MGVSVDTVDQRTKHKGKSDCILWDFLQDCILEHSGKDQDTYVFALAVYDMVIFPRVLEHVKITMVDLFEQICRQTNLVPLLQQK